MITILSVSFGVFGQPDFVKTLVSDAPVLALSLVSTFEVDGVDGMF
ncbi:MAG: hypothetical protein V4722_25755 [Bacteroidota bacterium]